MTLFGVLFIYMDKIQNAAFVSVNPNDVDHDGGFRVSSVILFRQKKGPEGPRDPKPEGSRNKTADSGVGHKLDGRDQLGFSKDPVPVR